MAAGCCTPPPPAAKYFDRVSPLSALKGFVYAVESRQWDYAYESLCDSSRQEIGRFKFEAAIRIAKDPVFHEVSVFDVIADSVLYAVEKARRGDRALIKVIPGVKNARGEKVYLEIQLVFVLEEDEWRLDFIESVNAIQRALGPQPDLTRR